MFGELGNSDIHDNEPNYGFDEFYNGDNGFSADNDRSVPSQDDELWDVGSNDSPRQPQMQQNAPYGGGVPPQTVNNQQNASAGVQQDTGAKKSSSIYLLLLLLVLVAAAGMFFYKKNMAPDTAANTEQAMGDYFYDKASADGAAQQASSEATATVDVNLGDSLPAKPESAAEQNANAQDGAAKDADNTKAEKEMTPLEKAMQKKKADEKKASQVGLSNSVIIPVSAGGRVDPFMPYIQSAALAKQPKFELIAPPTVIPDEDPVVDELVQTKVSGIMFDQARPSAIINIGGTDQLVHKGDVVKGYNIVNITKNMVVIKYKNNIYQATVGQTLDDGVNLNPVSGLSKQFGGLYTKPAGNVIQFNEQNTNN